ncbi:MAG: hypothetical protein Q8886_02765, partial [Candidatus Phytoplasma australasiaticum]|nr:hypothetical protein [Candidatus Phytoplasma australasiaticum]
RYLNDKEELLYMKEQKINISQTQKQQNKQHKTNQHNYHGGPNNRYEDQYTNYKGPDSQSGGSRSYFGRR